MDTTLNIIALNDAMQRGMQGNIERGFSMGMQLREQSLNMAARKMQMEQMTQKFPLEMDELKARGQEHAMTIDLRRKMINDSTADKAAFSKWIIDNPTSVKRLSVDAPAMRTNEGMNMVTQYLENDAKSLEGMAARLKKAQEIAATNPLVQQQIATAKAHQAYYERGGAKGIDGDSAITAPEEIKLPSGTTVIWQKGTRKWQAVSDKGKDSALDKDDLIELSIRAQNPDLRELAENELYTKFGVKPKENKGFWSGWFGGSKEKTPTAPPAAGSSPALTNPPSLKRFTYDPATGDFK